MPSVAQHTDGSGKTIGLIVGLLIIAGLGFGGWYLWKHHGSSDTPKKTTLESRLNDLRTAARMNVGDASGTACLIDTDAAAAKQAVTDITAFQGTLAAAGLNTADLATIQADTSAVLATATTVAGYTLCSAACPSGAPYNASSNTCTQYADLTPLEEKVTKWKTDLATYSQAWPSPAPAGGGGSSPDPAPPVGSGCTYSKSPAGQCSKIDANHQPQTGANQFSDSACTKACTPA
jgi:hypothetical protein